MSVNGPGERIDQLFNQVTNQGRSVTADGLYSLRREAIKDKELTSHEHEVLQRAVDLYNSKVPASRQVTLVDLTHRDPEHNADDRMAVELGLGTTREADQHTVRFHQGAPDVRVQDLEADGSGVAGASLSFDRFVENNRLGEVFRDPASPRHLPYLVDTDQNANGETVAAIISQLRLGQEETFGSVKQLQQYLNQHRPEGAPRLREDGKLGPQTVQAIRSKIEANIAGAESRLSLEQAIYPAQVMFRGLPTNRDPEVIGGVRIPNLRDPGLVREIRERAQYVEAHPLTIQPINHGRLSLD